MYFCLSSGLRSQKICIFINLKRLHILHVSEQLFCGEEKLGRLGYLSQRAFLLQMSLRCYQLKGKQAQCKVAMLCFLKVLQTECWFKCHSSTSMQLQTILPSSGDGSENVMRGLTYCCSCCFCHCCFSEPVRKKRNWPKTSWLPTG